MNPTTLSFPDGDPSHEEIVAPPKLSRPRGPRKPRRHRLDALAELLRGLLVLTQTRYRKEIKELIRIVEGWR